MLFVNKELSSDFMSVRKIPLKERPAFSKDLSPRNSGDEGEDPEVSIALSRIRKEMLKDRATYDKVRLWFYIARKALLSIVIF